MPTALEDGASSAHTENQSEFEALHLDPVLRPARLIRTVAPLRHQAFKAETCMHCEKFPEKSRVCLNELSWK
jgi:hypothetical protein